MIMDARRTPLCLLVLVDVQHLEGFDKALSRELAVVGQPP